MFAPKLVISVDEKKGNYPLFHNQIGLTVIYNYWKEENFTTSYVALGSLFI